MDIYGTATTAITQLIQVAIFIKGVISDMRSYEEDRATIQLKLDLQLVSLEMFYRRLLDKEGGLLIKKPPLSERATNAICGLLIKMNGVLAEYSEIISRYDLRSDLAVPTDADDNNNSSTAVDERRFTEWKNRGLKQVREKWKNLKLKGFHWALFDRERLLAVLSSYKEWSDNLRDLMQHFAQEAMYEMADAGVAGLSLAANAGLESVAKRQKVAAEPHAPDGFAELGGEIVDEASRSDGFQLARWVRADSSSRVMVEYRDYPAGLLEDDLDPEGIMDLKQPIRDLAWLLQNSSFADSDANAEQVEQPLIYSLQCIGYQDQVDKKRFALIYQLPFSVADQPESKAPLLLTLHERILQIEMKTKHPQKPPLGSRFEIAYCISLSLSNIHGSRWLHKNISSQGILLFQREEKGIRPLQPGFSGRGCLAFLNDWEYARPMDSRTHMRGDFDAVRNLYRHPDRQGAPGREFARKHDIYALGVVLLEIGMWRTMPQLFASRIKDAQRTGKLPRAKDVYQALLSLAQISLANEMGSNYSAAVIACLKGDFAQSSDVDFSLDFREKVIDRMSIGLKL
ncbi:uncharacterized protein FTJAE_14255 [Fusarium tjaetaba]|uniref:Prion-inhibition and propagation HeLo domain-containing protein n=1 Tax=Fusarium tjaetaba TaxID=1567544 RepID=A0A8H5V712_9HYPO|nr:uncharacterized protein FTJAE_14255 [Fusarium tjaetaba]KAF5610579.1 hypothetical protein FTJAE_14255 [Fusarium tjaetaba]